MRPKLREILGWWLVFVTALVAAIVVVAGVDAALAHDTAEITEWEDDWERQVREARGLSPDLIAQMLEFEANHAWYYAPAPPESHRMASPGLSGGYVDSSTTFPAAVEQWRPLVAGHFRPGDVDTALCLMWHESKGNPSARNPRSTATGLFQVLAFWSDHFGLDPTVPEHNTYMAAQIRDLQGWAAWSPYNRGLCR